MYILAGAEGIYQLFLKLFTIQFTWKSKSLLGADSRGREDKAGEKELRGVTFPISQALLWTGQCSENSGKQLQGFPVRQAATFNNIDKEGGKLSQRMAWQLASLGENRTRWKSLRRCTGEFHIHVQTITKTQQRTTLLMLKCSPKRGIQPPNLYFVLSFTEQSSKSSWCNYRLGVSSLESKYPKIITFTHSKFWHKLSPGQIHGKDTSHFPQCPSEVSPTMIPSRPQENQPKRASTSSISSPMISDTLPKCRSPDSTSGTQCL